MYTIFQIMWAQVDPNGHLRHSAYYDLAAQVRVNGFNQFKLSIQELLKLGIGPILFREEARFLREVHLNDEIKVDMQVAAMREDGYKWSIRHNFYKQDDLVAVVTVDGAWMDLKKRKVTIPPEHLQKAFQNFPKTEDFKSL
ncbi:MAG: acyl-CoA thioesterase [Candidatus Cyclobacteriaceae bacterium M2_1C_046]